MAFGFSPVIPLQEDNEDGFYVLTKTLAENTKQNFKNLLLTVPGERVMHADFGVGLRTMLFGTNRLNLENEIARKIDEQVNTYMPFLQVDDIEFLENDPNMMGVKIFYSVPSLSLSDLLTVSKISVI
jgi:phage baseplate assembly protein W